MLRQKGRPDLTENVNDQSLFNQVVRGGELNGARLPPYHRVDLGVKRLGSFIGVADYELQLQVINVYSRRNVWFPVFDFDEVPVGVEYVRQLPILPNVSLSLDF